MKNNYITRETCDKNHSNIMDKFDLLKKEINEVNLTLAVLPEKLMEKMDGKYAGKYLEDKVEKIKEKQEQRTYDWLKYMVGTFIAMVLTLLVYRSFN